jgi:hypothetical protein
MQSRGRTRAGRRNLSSNSSTCSFEKNNCVEYSHWLRLIPTPQCQSSSLLVHNLLHGHFLPHLPPSSSPLSSRTERPCSLYFVCIVDPEPKGSACGVAIGRKRLHIRSLVNQTATPHPLRVLSLARQNATCPTHLYSTLPLRHTLCLYQ